MQAWKDKIMEQNEACRERYACFWIEERNFKGTCFWFKRRHFKRTSAGRIEKLQELIEKKVQKGYCVEEILEILETGIETVQKFIKNRN